MVFIIETSKMEKKEFCEIREVGEKKKERKMGGGRPVHSPVNAIGLNRRCSADFPRCFQ